MSEYEDNGIGVRERFADLGEHVASEAWQPSFEEVRARRHRRTQRVALSAVAVAVTVALVGAGLGVGVLRGSASGQVPAGPLGSSELNPSPPFVTPSPQLSAAGPAEVVAVAASGGTFSVVTRQCFGACDGSQAGGYGEWKVLTSTDLGKSWHAVPLEVHQPAGPALYWVTADGVGWLAQPDSGVLASVPRGGGPAPQWQYDPLATAVVGDAVGNVLWLGWGGHLRRVVSPDSSGEPLGRPSGTIVALAALDAATPLYADLDDTGGNPAVTWMLGSGQVGDPCAGTPHAGTAYVHAATAHPAGGPTSIWVTCAGEPSAGQQPKAVVVSSDGVHWTGGAALETSGYATTVVPVSATTAWRYGGRADIYRTTDGHTWKDVAQTAQVDGVVGFAALDATRAGYLARGSDDQVHWYATTDGGAHWTEQPFAP